MPAAVFPFLRVKRAHRVACQAENAWTPVRVNAHLRAALTPDDRLAAVNHTKIISASPRDLIQRGEKKRRIRAGANGDAGSQRRAAETADDARALYAETYKNPVVGKRKFVSIEREPRLFIGAGKVASGDDFSARPGVVRDTPRRRPPSADRR